MLNASTQPAGFFARISRVRLAVVVEHGVAAGHRDDVVQRCGRGLRVDAVSRPLSRPPSRRWRGSPLPGRPRSQPQPHRVADQVGRPPATSPAAADAGRSAQPQSPPVRRHSSPHRGQTRVSWVHRMPAPPRSAGARPGRRTPPRGRRRWPPRARAPARAPCQLDASAATSWCRCSWSRDRLSSTARPGAGARRASTAASPRRSPARPAVRCCRRAAARARPGCWRRRRWCRSAEGAQARRSGRPIVVVLPLVPLTSVTLAVRGSARGRRPGASASITRPPITPPAPRPAAPGRVARASRPRRPRHRPRTRPGRGAARVMPTPSSEHPVALTAS